MNLIGLAAGLTTCMLILIFLSNEYSYDKFMDNRDRLYRLTTVLDVSNSQRVHIPTTSYPVAPGLAAEIPAIESWTRFRFGGNEVPTYVDEKVFLENHLIYVDSTFFQVIDFELIKGDASTVLNAPNKVVLAQSTAERFFGKEDPIGKEIRFSEENRYEVTGIAKDVPQPSHFPEHSMFLSISSLTIGGAEYWVGRPNYGSYVVLKEGQKQEEVQETINEVYYNNAKEVLDLVGAKCDATLQPVKDIHFDTSFDFTYDFQPTISHQKITIFAALGIFILLIACVSFINLATARSNERVRQIGISKAIGATRNILIMQNIGEFVFTSLLALLIAFLLTYLLLPYFNGFVGRDLVFNLFQNYSLLFSSVALALFVGITAGLYPSIFLTSFTPSNTIKGDFTLGNGRSGIRSGLILFQFIISIVLVISTFTVVRQLKFMDTLSPGFNKDQLIVLRNGPDMSRDDCEKLWLEVSDHPGIQAATISNFLPMYSHMEYTYEVTDESDIDKLMSRRLDVDHRFIETMDMTLISGRNFREADTTDIAESIIINETAAKKLGWKDPIGHIIDANPAQGEEHYWPQTIIGVVKDINFESLHHEVLPMVLDFSDARPRFITFRLHQDQISDAIVEIEKTWMDNFPTAPFRYQFFDENFGEMYEAEIQLQQLFMFFTVLAIVISCNGLFALIAFAAERRTKEIGIRKVLGASTGSLMSLLIRGYLFLVVIANIVAWPISVYIMNKWVENFAYRAPFAWWIYPLAGVFALLLAFFTVGTLAYRASQANPIRSLRQE